MSESPPISTYRQILQTLEDLRDAGIHQLPKPRLPSGPTTASAAEIRNVAAEHSMPSPQVETLASEPLVTTVRTPPPHTTTQAQPMFVPAEEITGSPASTAPDLHVLREEVANCTQCHELATTRKQTVFGVGNPRARLCLMGEAPGADEDRLGEPFVGRAGQLLNKILEACRLRREDVYILNVLKCRPPNNRTPTPEESQNCRGFLNRQLELISPEFICCLGAVAAQNLLGTTESIGRLRGRQHEYHGIKVVCTYHPAYLLRTPAAKKHTWDDMKLLMRLMGTPVD